MILDLLTNAKPGGVYRGKVRTAEWSELEQQYKYNYFHCNIDRLNREDAREDARQLAVDIATENGLEIVHTETKHSITAVQKEGK